uniref:Secreted protein n=1 Tax=Haemonchus contortus TaxID=6289 RepID=A0A7I4YZ69_HAECO
MLLILPILAFFLAVVASEVSKPLPKGALEATKKANIRYTAKDTKNYYRDMMKTAWRDDLSVRALKWLQSPEKVKGGAVINGQKSFPEAEPKQLKKKVFALVSDLLEKYGQEKHVVPPILYGCNGNVTKGEANSVLSVACLYIYQ